MDAQTKEVLNGIVEKTQSDLLMFFVIFVIALVVVAVPLYAMMIKDRKTKRESENNRQDKYIEREKQVLQVITDNTQVIAGLKATLEISNTAISTSLNRILDGTGANSITMAQVQTTLDRNTSNQTVMQGQINKILTIVDNYPHNNQCNNG